MKKDAFTCVAGGLSSIRERDLEIALTFEASIPFGPAALLPQPR